MDLKEQFIKAGLKRKKLGIFGFPVKHSLSPIMHRALYRRLGIDADYLPIAVSPDELEDAFKFLREMDMLGVNITVPHKVECMRYLDKIDKAAEAIGAVNTVFNKKGRLTGFNTDHLGFERTLKVNGVDLKGMKVVMFGAGGAAHAVAYAVERARPGRFFIYNIDIPMIERLVKKLGLKDVTTGDLKKTDEKDAVIADADFVVNTTSVGMHDNALPYVVDRFKTGSVFYDLIYAPPKTGFLRRAEEGGAKIINGLDMLIYQGAESFNIWFNREADVEVMKKAITNR